MTNKGEIVLDKVTRKFGALTAVNSVDQVIEGGSRQCAELACQIGRAHV